MSVFLSDVIEKALPTAVDEVLARILGDRIRPAREDGRHRVTAWGSFAGHLTEGLLTLGGHPRFTGAFVVAEEEAERIFAFRGGALVGTASNVLFERLGRLLYPAVVVTHDDSETLVETEEQQGDGALLDWIPEDVLAWAVERRVAAVCSALPYIKRGHFVFVEGEPDLRGLPALALDPSAVASEARRLYEAWRHGPADAAGDERPPADAPAPLPSPLTRRASREEHVDDILRRIREADLDFK